MRDRYSKTVYEQTKEKREKAKAKIEALTEKARIQEIKELSREKRATKQWVPRTPEEREEQRERIKEIEARLKELGVKP